MRKCLQSCWRSIRLTNYATDWKPRSMITSSVCGLQQNWTPLNLKQTTKSFQEVTALKRGWSTFSKTFVSLAKKAGNILRQVSPKWLSEKNRKTKRPNLFHDHGAATTLMWKRPNWTNSVRLLCSWKPCWASKVWLSLFEVSECVYLNESPYLKRCLRFVQNKPGIQRFNVGLLQCSLMNPFRPESNSPACRNRLLRSKGKVAFFRNCVCPRTIHFGNYQ